MLLNYSNSIRQSVTMVELRRIGRVDTLMRNCCRTAPTGRSTFPGSSSALALALILVSGGAGGEGAPAGFLRQLRFSPNGEYVLGQDDFFVTVLTSQPFAILFRIPAERRQPPISHQTRGMWCLSARPREQTHGKSVSQRSLARSSDGVSPSRVVSIYPRFRC